MMMVTLIKMTMASRTGTSSLGVSRMLIVMTMASVMVLSRIRPVLRTPTVMMMD